MPPRLKKPTSNGVSAASFNGFTNSQSVSEGSKLIRSHQALLCDGCWDGNISRLRRSFQVKRVCSKFSPSSKDLRLRPSSGRRRFCPHALLTTIHAGSIDFACPEQSP